MPASRVAQNLDRLHAEIRAAAEDNGRRAEDVRLIAVSKTLPTELVSLAYDWGQRDFGENRVQELEFKAPLMPKDCQWHLIGHLQRNKVRAAVRSAAWIHSVDSLELLARIDSIAGDEERHPQILVQVNIAGEATKSGVEADEATRLVEAAMKCTHLDCRGFMTIAPLTPDPDAPARVFRELSELRGKIEQRLGMALPELSMGMSGDFREAIAAGATMVRVGTSVFGSRS